MVISTAACNACPHQRLAHQLVLQIADFFDNLFLGIADVNQVVESGRNDYIDILINGGADYQAFMLSIVTREIGRASGKADAQWCLRDDHFFSSRPDTRPLTDSGAPG